MDPSKPQLALASTSPRRSALLAAANIGFVCVAPGDEPAAGGDPREVARIRARSKAEGAQLPADLTLPALGVDTVVDVDGAELGKPRDVAHAAAMLRSLLGRSHKVYTAHCLWDPRAGQVREELAEAVVVGRQAHDEEVVAYLDSGQWQGKAGGYGIQDEEQSFLSVLEGAFDTVMGLHVQAVQRLLRWAGS
ncbi:MAG: Maf family protein [Planctomycetota bacterium]|nr:Maf family protein [Planctomycetota bacterium]